MADLPELHHHAYRIAIDWIGEDGDVVAHGHQPPLRFLAAANHMARKVAGLPNLLDDRSHHDDLAGAVRHTWAVSEPDLAAEWGYEWAIRYDSKVTADTPGAFPVTMLDMAGL